MSKFETLEYPDHSYEGYKEAKNIFLNKFISLEIFSIGHKNDNRFDLNITLKDEAKDKSKEELKKEDFNVEKKEIKDIPVSSLIPLGSKLYYFPPQVLSKLIHNHQFFLRHFINESLFVLFDDDVFSFQLCLKDKILLEGKGQLKDLKINLEYLKKEHNITQNSLISLKLKLEESGEVRNILEDESFLKENKNTKEFLKHITSKEYILTKIDMVPNDELKKERFKFYNIPDEDINSKSIDELILLIPDEYDFDFEYVIDIAGYINNFNTNFSNKFIETINYHMSIYKIEQLLDFFDEKVD